MKRIALFLSLFALMSVLCLSGVAQASSASEEGQTPAEKTDKAEDASATATSEKAESSKDAKADDGNLTEGEIEQQGYEKRADLVKDLKNRVQVVQDGLGKLAEEFKDDELKKALVDELKELADKAQAAVDKLQDSSQENWQELEKKAEEVLKELDAFVEKVEKKLS